MSWHEYVFLALWILWGVSVIVCFIVCAVLTERKAREIDAWWSKRDR